MTFVCEMKLHPFEISCR